MREPRPRQRRRHGELKFAIRDYLAVNGGGPASIGEIRAGVRDTIGDAPDSSYRSALQDEQMFERVARGVFKLRG